MLNDELLMHLARTEIAERLVAAEHRRLLRLVAPEPVEPLEGSRRDG